MLQRFARCILIPITSLFALAGCSSSEPPMLRSEADNALFGPVAMRLHPIFTQVKDWTGDNKPDGIEALVELQDQFGDPTKASGRVRFELSDYRPYDPERKGERIARWDGDLETLDEQRDRWNRTSRTYAFQLSQATLQLTRTYVLTAQFDLSNGGRFFAQLILEGQRPLDDPLALPPTTGPATAPTGATGFSAPPVTASPSEPANSPPANHQP